MMVETDITASITASQIGQAVILVIMYMYVRTFKPVIIVFICNVIMCLTSH
jgi:preprotein translocase subunit SecD